MAKSGLGEMPEKEERGTSFSGNGLQEGGGKGPGMQSGSETKGVGGGERPDLRVVQVEYDSRLGKTVFKDVGAMWRNTSKSGNEFYTMKIGKLKLLVFPNNKE